MGRIGRSVISDESHIMQSDEPKYVNIVFPIPVDSQFSYLLPEQLRAKAQVGMRVLAPFGKGDKETEGVIVEIPKKPEVEKLKEVTDILDNEPFFSEEMLKLTKWMAEYYFSTWGEALKCATPAGVNIAHKFGEFGQMENGKLVSLELHDCGIIYKPGHDFFLCVMTKGNNTQIMGQTIANLTKLIYDSL